MNQDMTSKPTRVMNRYGYRIGILLLFIPIIGHSAIVHVPDDHLTIQGAIDSSVDGDTILIANGTYTGTGNIDLQWDARSRHLVIMSENGPENCVIDCKREGRGFILDVGQDNRDVIDGLTITGGWCMGSGGGAIVIYTTSPKIKNCILVNNKAGFTEDEPFMGGYFVSGGAIACVDHAAPIIIGNIIRENYASSAGGGIRFTDNCSGILANNIIANNECAWSGGGGVSLYNHSNPLIINNLIINNYSRDFDGGGFGGGISSRNCSPLIINNTIAHNTTQNVLTFGEGGGIAMTGGLYPTIMNCIIYYNASSSTSMNIGFDPMDWLDISYCNVEIDLDHIFDLEPHTNFDSIPGFVDTINGDYQLMLHSPSINMGDPDTTGLHLPSFDLAGNNRIIGGRIDMGAYEYTQFTSLPDRSGPEGFQVYPNPFQDHTTISYHLSRPAEVEMSIFNSTGQLVASFPDVGQTAGKHQIEWCPQHQAGGIYFVRLRKGSSNLYKKMIFLE